MQEKDPLRIFTEEELEILTQSNLIEFKRQKLLRFQLTEGYTVKFNTYILDKNSVILIFEELETSLSRYLFVYKIPEFRHFLTSNNLSEIKNLASIDLDKFSNENKRYLLNGVRDKINNQLGNDIIQGKISPRGVKLVVTFIEKHYSVNIYNDLENVFKVLENYLDEISELFKEPFISLHSSKLEFKARVTVLLNSSFYSSLSMLPATMASIKVSYASTCRKLLNYVVSRRLINTRSYKKATLYSIREAMYIVLNNFNDAIQDRNIKIITNYLNDVNNKNENSNNWVNIILFIFLMILFLFLTN